MTILVIGCGSIGRRHLRLLAQKSGLDLIGFDVSADRRAEAAQIDGVRVVGDLEEGWAARPSAALICTPTRLHVAHAREAIRHGAHVFIEKPIGDTLDGVDDLLAEADRCARHILVGCNLRFERGLQRVRQLLADDAIGRVLGARVVFGQHLPQWHPWEDYRAGYSARSDLGGGIVLDAIHEIDYIRWLLGEVRSVTAICGRVGDLEIDVEDSADVLLRFQDGIVASIHLDYLQQVPERSLLVSGTRGVLKWSIQERTLRWFSTVDRTWRAEDWSHDRLYSIDDMYAAELDHFLSCVRGDASPVLDGRQARRVLEIALAVKQSSREGRTVDL